LRPSIKSKHPNLKLGGTMKELGKLWSTYSEEDKLKYTKLHEEDKKRYEDEIEEYNLNR